MSGELPSGSSRASALPPPEYVTDVPYERTFLPQIAPSTLRLVAALNGVTPPPENDFDYCELGSAMGDTLVTLAAANPRARFVGVDINAAHVAFAKDLATRGDVANVRFLDRDIEGLEGEELPPLDFIGAHGFLSWVSAAKRKAVLAFAAARLKPGGLLYVSYNALPGWAAIEPLRRLMLEASPASGPTLDRALNGFKTAQRFAEAGAGYFANHPTAKSMLALMQKAGLSYVVHEYFHAHWQALYFADVARDMATHGLEFVGQVPLHQNVRELALPPALKELAKAAGGDRIQYETLKDFGLNELFRSDVFVKGSATPSEAVRRSYFEETAFGTLAPSARFRRSVKLPVYSLDYSGPVYDALLPEIATSAATATELAARPKLAGLGAQRIGDCLQNLSLGGQVVPMRPQPPASPGRNHRISLPLNKLIVEQVLAATGPLVLAAPTAGAGLPVTLMETICLHLLTEVHPAARASWIRSFAERRSPPLTIGDRPLEDRDELVRIVTRELETFTAVGLPKLLELGIVERT